jgi:hypothetical protein
MADSNATASGRTPRDLLGLACLYAQLGASLWIVPDWSPSAEPVYLAAVGGVATSVFIAILRAAGMRGSAVERTALALFLGGMPLVYVASWLVAPAPGWLGIELVGVAIFVPLAVLGMTRSAWFLAAGIVAHGLGWDLWHYGHTPFVPDWYTIGCLVADVGIGIYAAIEAPALDGFSARSALRPSVQGA